MPHLHTSRDSRPFRRTFTFSFCSSLSSVVEALMKKENSFCYILFYSARKPHFYISVVTSKSENVI